MAKFVINQSKVNKWRQCHQAYHYRYVEELVRRIARRPLVFGSIIHRMIEAHGEGEDPFKVLDDIDLKNAKLFNAEREMYGELIEDIRVIMKEYIDFFPSSELRFVRIGDRRTEHEFAIDMTDELVFKGQIDAIGRTPNKLMWLVENKSFSNLPSEDHRWRNLQSAVYIRAIPHLIPGANIAGVCWNYIRSKPPTIPRLLNDGRLGPKNIVTLPYVLKAAAIEHNVAIPKKLMARAVQARSEYFQRIFTPINQTVVARLWEGFIDSGREMMRYHSKRQDMNLGRHCEWCDYEPICRAKLTGADVDFIKEREYEHEDPESHRRSNRDPEGVAVARSRGKGSSQLRVLR